MNIVKEMVGTNEKVLTKSSKKLSMAVFEKMYAFFGLILMSVILTILSPNFLTTDNLISVALQTAIIAILAIGQSYVIITSGIDLSVGSVLALSGVVSAQLLVSGLPVPLAILIGVLVGALLGIINGFILTKGNLPPFIVTLGMMGVARGLALVLTDGLPVSGLPQEFTMLGNERLFFIPIPVIFLIIVGIIAHFVLSRTVFGRYVYSIGSNEEATKLSGINVNFHKIIIYGISGLAAGIGGVLMASRLVSAQPTAGMSYELDAIAAVVIGGASLMGGVGTITGTIIGAFIMGVLRNGLNLLNVSPFWQQIAIGVVIVLAVYIDQIKRKNK
jgi:ribose transport system permease protein